MDSLVMIVIGYIAFLSACAFKSVLNGLFNLDS